MHKESFLRLQHSEGLLAEMASRLLAAFIISGRLNERNEDELIVLALKMAYKLAKKADAGIDSDDESREP